MPLSSKYQTHYGHSNNLSEAWALLRAELPEVDHIKLYGLVMNYHNTFVNEVSALRAQ